jgi:kinesin family protein C1
MEQAEKELREEVYHNQQQKSSIKIKRKALELSREGETPFFQLLENGNKEENKSLINKLINPEKETIYELTKNIFSQKSQDLDQEQSSINKYILHKLSEYLEIIQKREAIEEKFKNTLIKSSQLRQYKEEIQLKIDKNREETRKYEKKLEDKKVKEKEDLTKLQLVLCTLRLDQGNANKERNKIQHEIEENTRIVNKKKEELNKLKELNAGLTEKIKYYNDIIQYQTQLHTDIQVYKNQTNNEYQEAKGNVRVFCRIRPPLPKELTKKQINIEYRGDNSLIIKGEKKTSYIGRDGIHQDIEQFQFNRIFKQEDTQEEVFEEVSPLIQSSLDGFNINIFAYGQTGSGKTFTMEGDLSSPEKYGIVPRAVDRIFKCFNDELGGTGWEMKFFYLYVKYIIKKQGIYLLKKMWKKLKN